MLMAVFTTFATSRKEPLGETVARIQAAFEAAGFGAPAIRFSMSDPPITPMTEALGIKRVSSVERVLRRWPELAPFVRPGERKKMSNLMDDGTTVPIDFAILKEVAQGVPKSFPCHRFALHFSAEGFSDGPKLPATASPQSIATLARAGIDVFGHPTTAGISVTDAWGANSRQRSLAALRLVDGDPAAKKLASPPDNVQAVLSACGKVRKTVQVPLVMPDAAGPGAAEDRDMAALRSETGEAVRAVLQAYRERMAAWLEQLPHDLPHLIAHEAPSLAPSAIPATGPRKPELAKAFAPMGYDCRSENGSFKLQRQTAGNLAVQIRVDIGGWGTTVNATMQVIGLPKDQDKGPGFKATLKLPLSRRAARSAVTGADFVGQLPIGGPDRWRQIVENLAHLVAALDRSFVPDVEGILGPSPEWFQPEMA
jgi:hypothetical protein